MQAQPWLHRAEHNSQPPAEAAPFASHPGINLAAALASQRLSADLCNPQKWVVFCHLKGWGGSGKDLLGAVAGSKVGVRHQDQDWESKGWGKHRELRTIFQCLQAIKCAQWCVKPQPCHVMCNLMSRLSPTTHYVHGGSVWETRSDPLMPALRCKRLTRGSPACHTAVSGSGLPMATQTSVSMSHSEQTTSTTCPMPDERRKHGPGGVLLFQIRMLNTLPAGSSSDHTARGETRTCRTGCGGVEGREPRGDPALWSSPPRSER